MLTEYEAQSMRARMYRELNSEPRTVWQCAAGLLIVISLAAAGMVHDPAQSRSSNSMQVQERAPNLYSPADDLDAQTYRVEPEASGEASSEPVPVAASHSQAVE